MFRPGGSDAVLLVDGRGKTGKASGENNPSAPGFTDESAEVISLREATEEESTDDAATRARARKTTARLAVRRSRRDAGARRKIGGT